MTRPAREIHTDPAHPNEHARDKYNKRINTHRLQNNKDQRKREKNLHHKKGNIKEITEEY
jgi:hypothetical protein